MTNNREIKFRLKLDGKIVGLCRYLQAVHSFQAIDQSGQNHFDVKSIDEIEHDAIEQFTGIKDMNGQEVYEGDEIMFSCEYYSIEKRRGVIKLRRGGFGDGTYMMNGMRDIKVIGREVHDGK